MYIVQPNGRRLYDDIKVIFTLTRKKNFLGYEILDIKNKGVKLKTKLFS